MGDEDISRLSVSVTGVRTSWMEQFQPPRLAAVSELSSSAVPPMVMALQLGGAESGSLVAAGLELVVVFRKQSSRLHRARVWLRNRTVI